MEKTMRKTLLIGSMAVATLVGTLSSNALAQARIYPQINNCLAPQTAMQRQACSMQREPYYTTDSRISAERDSRLEMNLDNGGGGTQSPNVPNTTGAPATTGGADGIGLPVN